MRTEPPMSVPSSKQVNPAATAAAAPPDDPPHRRSRSQGLLVVPKMSLNVWKSPDHRGRLVLPKTIAPASLSRATEGASAVGTWSVSSVAPPVERMPPISIASLIVTGRPCNGPRTSPRAVAASAASAADACTFGVERDDRVDPPSSRSMRSR